MDNLSTGLQGNVDLVVKNGEFHFADIRDVEAVEACMADSDAVIHLAAQVSVPASIDNEKENWDVNVHGTANVLNTAKKLESLELSLHLQLRCTGCVKKCH